MKKVFAWRGSFDGAHFIAAFPYKLFIHKDLRHGMVKGTQPLGFLTKNKIKIKSQAVQTGETPRESESLFECQSNVMPLVKK